MKSALLLLICAFAVCATAQRTADKMTKLSVDLSELRNSPDDRTAQMHYLDEFPKTYKQYLQCFDLGQPLYDGHEYVVVISRLAPNHELAVGNILVNLSQDAHYDADAPSYLQHSTSEYAGQYTKTFVSLLKKLPPVRRLNYHPPSGCGEPSCVPGIPADH